MTPQVDVKPRNAEDADVPEELERALTLQLLTQTVPQTVPQPLVLTLSPAASKALRDRLRDGRNARRMLRQIEAIQAAHGAMIDRVNRAVRRQVKIWVFSSLAIWAWAIWMIHA